MPKKKKTKEQKMLADQRRDRENQSLYTFTSPLPESQKKHPATAQHTATISTASYKYLGGDLRKTLLLTFFIIVAEVVIYYLI